MSNALVPFNPDNLDQALSLAKTLSMSSLLPDALKKRPEDVFVTILTGRELGLSPMQSLRGMHVINGKAVMSSDLMLGLVLSKRDVCEYFRLVESTDAKATYETKRVGSQPVKLSFTIQQAQQAGLTGKDTWKKYGAAMLRARCAAALARAVYPDLLAGVYETDEGEDIRRNRHVEKIQDAIDVSPVASPEPDETSIRVDELCAALDAAQSETELRKLSEVKKSLVNLTEEQDAKIKAAAKAAKARVCGTKSESTKLLQKLKEVSEAKPELPPVDQSTPFDDEPPAEIQ